MFQNFFPHTICSIFSEESTNPLSSLINLFIQIFILSQVKKTTKKGALDADQESQVNIFPTLHLISTPLQIKILFLSKPLLVKSKMIQLFHDCLLLLNFSDNFIYVFPIPWKLKYVSIRYMIYITWHPKILYW